MPVLAFLAASSGHSPLPCVLSRTLRAKVIGLSAAEHVVAWTTAASSPLLQLRFGTLVENAVVERVDRQRGLLMLVPNQQGRVQGYARLFQLADEKVLPEPFAFQSCLFRVHMRASALFRGSDFQVSLAPCRDVFLYHPGHCCRHKKIHYR